MIFMLIFKNKFLELISGDQFDEDEANLNFQHLDWEIRSQVMLQNIATESF